METAIIQNNQKHFAQAEGTPPTKPPLSTILGNGHNNSCTKILQGQFIAPTNLPMQMKRYLEEMERTNKHPTNKALIPPLHIIDGFKKWREQTSTSPSGIHLGHYKALLAPDGTVYTKQNPDPAIHIWSIITLIINASISIERGPDSWEHVHQLVMKKKAVTIDYTEQGTSTNTKHHII